MELHIFAFWHNKDHGDGELQPLVDFSLISFEGHGGCRGIRTFVVAPESCSLDDCWGRALFGMFKHYDGFVIEILFIKILFS